MVKRWALSARLRAKELKATKHLIAFGSYKKCRFTHYGGSSTAGRYIAHYTVYIQVLVVRARQLNSVTQLVRAL